MAKNPPTCATPNSPQPANFSGGQHLTTASGRPLDTVENSITAGLRGLVLQEYYVGFGRLAQFNREGIPEPT